MQWQNLAAGHVPRAKRQRLPGNPAPRPKPAAEKKKKGLKGDVVQLKPLYEQIGLTILELETLGPNEQAKYAIQQLEACRAEFSRMCGPTMDIPRGAILA